METAVLYACRLAAVAPVATVRCQNTTSGTPVPMRADHENVRDQQDGRRSLDRNRYQFAR
jgi:hypothetical protein